MKTRKGPKVRTPPGPPQTFTAKEKESCEEQEHGHTPTRNNCRRYYQKVATHSDCLREGRKAKNVSGGEQDRVNSSSKSPQREWPQLLVYPGGNPSKDRLDQTLRSFAEQTRSGEDNKEWPKARYNRLQHGRNKVQSTPLSPRKG